MAFDRRLLCQSARLSARRTAPHRLPAVSGRNPLDPNQWRPLERFARTLSVARNVLETAPRLDPQRRLPGRVGSSPRQARSAQTNQLGGSDRRWLVFPGKKGGDEVGRTPKGNGTRILLMVDADGTPLSAFTTAAHHNEVNTVETLVEQRQLCYQTPRRLLYDKAVDADWLRERLAGIGIELICPHRANRTSRRVKTVAHSDATSAATASNEASVGCIVFAGSSRAGNTIPTCSKGLSTWLACSPV